jgi:hypothetical protein
MNCYEHCSLCAFQTLSIEHGTLCGLTGEKPQFTTKCPTIEFDEKLISAIKQVNIELRLVQNSRRLAIFHLVKYLTISLGLIAFAVWFALYPLEKYGVSFLYIGIIGVAILIIPFAFAGLNQYRTKLPVAVKKKTTLDDVLKCYDLEYDIEIQLGKKIHGVQDVHVILSTMFQVP